MKNKSPFLYGIAAGAIALVVVVAICLYWLLVTTKAIKPTIPAGNYSVGAIQKAVDSDGVLQRAATLSQVPVNTQPTVQASSGDVGKNDIASFE